MHLSAIMITYNDEYYIKQSVESIKDYVDSFCIVEGAFQKTIEAGYPSRSNDIVLDYLSTLSDDDKFEIKLANEYYEVQQRQISLDMAIKKGADWVLLIDSDEVYDRKSIQNIRNLIENQPKYAGYEIPSRCFVNNFWTWHRMEVPRLFKITSNSRFVGDNHIDSSGPYGFVDPKDICYFHYSYVKDSNAFNCKFDRIKQFSPEFDRTRYAYYALEKAIVAHDGNGFYPYEEEHPSIMDGHCKRTPKPDPNDHWKELNTLVGIHEIRQVKWNAYTAN